MPWLAIPFDKLGLYKQLLSAQYGVRGIPSLVILDAMSGRVVVSKDVSRREVIQACQRGEAAIESLLKDWLDRVPTDSKEMLQMLEISCGEEAAAAKKVEPSVVNPYLVRKDVEGIVTQRTEELVAQLMADGLDREEAMEAAKAIEEVSSEQVEPLELEPGPLNGVFQRKPIPPDPIDSEATCADRILEGSGRDSLLSVLSTICKYVENSKKSPWTPKFRRFPLSQKVADRVTRVPGGIDLLQALGLEIYGTDEDFVASIPVYADVDAMHAKVVALQEKYSTSN
jgi:hypothetical protein